MTEADYLLQTMKQVPFDEALYCAYADELLANGEEEKASLVRQLIDAEKHPFLRYPSVKIINVQRCRLRFMLGLRKIEANDDLCEDGENGVFPVDKL